MAAKPVQRSVSAQAQHYQGPIPPPAMLAEFNKVDPTFAERIVRMAEVSLQAQIDSQKVESVRAHRENMVTIWLAGGLAFSGISVTVVLALVAPSWGAFIPAILGFIPGVISALAAFRSKK